MASPTTVVSNYPKHAANALLALGTLKLMLATDTYTPDQDTLDYVNDVTNEAAGTGYTAGGLTLTTPTVTLDTATNTVKIDADDVPSTFSVSCRWGVIYVDTAVAATSPVLGYVDFSEGLGGNVTLTGVEWDADGVIVAVVAA